MAALTPLTIGRSRFKAAAMGALWGGGHSTGQVRPFLSSQQAGRRTIYYFYYYIYTYNYLTRPYHTILVVV